MKFVIIGTNGFLSSAFAKYCNQNNYYLYMYGLEAPIYNHCDRFVKINLLKESLDITNLLNADVIIYSVGAGIQSSLKESEAIIYNLNVTIPIDICSQLNLRDYKGSFVSFGSYFELGDSFINKASTEEDIINSTSITQNAYILSKRLFTKFVSSYKRSFRHIHFILPTIYGPGENPNRLIPYTINNIQNNLIPSYTEGYQVRQYINVNDVCKIIDITIKSGAKSGIYNIPGAETLSVKDIISIIYNYFGKEIPNNIFGKNERLDSSMAYLELCGNKLLPWIGNNKMKTIKDSLEEYCL